MYYGLAFASVVCGDLPPVYRIPFIYGGRVAMGLKPPLGSVDEVEERGRLARALQQGLAPLLAHPCQGDLAIGIDDELGELPLLDEGKSMHDGQEFADVVRPLREGTHLEDRTAGGKVDASVLHHARIAGAGRIDYDGFFDRHLGGALHPRGSTVASGEALGPFLIGSEGIAVALEGLEDGGRVSLGLALAFGPSLIDSWLVTSPDDVPLSFLCHWLA